MVITGLLGAPAALASAPPDSHVVATSSPAVGVASSGWAGNDYASTVFGQAWNFRSGSDLLTDTNGPTEAISGQSIHAVGSAEGSYAGTVTHQGYFSPVWDGYPGSLYNGHDGNLAANAINASYYRVLSFQAYSTGSIGAGIFWFNCATVSSACEGGMPFSLQAGWHTYSFPLANNPFFHLPAAWGGWEHGLRIALSAPGTDSFQFHWLRLWAPGTSLVATFGTAGQTETLKAANPANGEWFTIPCQATSACTATGAGTRVDLGLLPPGTWILTAQHANGSPAGTATVQMVGPDLATVTSPSPLGCADYATTHLGHPWGPGDVQTHPNATVTAIPGGVLGQNTGPITNDPHLTYRLGVGGIDPNTWHIATYTMTYSGTFNLSGAPGGGTMARLGWSRSDTGTRIWQSDDLLSYQSAPTYTVDLARPDILEPTIPGDQPFVSSHRVTMFRFDPNEDPGNKRWTVTGMYLRATCRATTTNTLAVTWSDPSAAPGTLVTIYAHSGTGATTSGGTVLASGLADNGRATVSTAHLPRGGYFLYLVLARNGLHNARPGGPFLVDAAPLD